MNDNNRNRPIFQSAVPSTGMGWYQQRMIAAVNSMLSETPGLESSRYVERTWDWSSETTNHPLQEDPQTMISSIEYGSSTRTEPDGPRVRFVNDYESLQQAIRELGPGGGTVYLENTIHVPDGYRLAAHNIRFVGATGPPKKEQMIICFTGHRDCITHRSELEEIRFKHKGAKWIHGGAKDGFDKQVAEFIEWDGNIEFEVFPPKYNLYAPNYAPIERNRRMVDQADLLIACYDQRITGGTHDTIKYATRIGVLIEFVTAYQSALVVK